MKKVLITGSSGMLGGSLIRAFLPDKRFSLTGMSRSFTGLLSDKDQIRVDFSQPASLQSVDVTADVIIHTAAITDLKLCETDPELAHKVHVEATAELVKKVKPGGVFLYISTDSVFDGKKGGYSESDVPNPLNTYAQTKLKGEQVSLAGFSRTMVIRTNIYGFHDGLKNSLAEWAFQEWSKGKSISGFTDIIFNALYTGQLADVIKTIVEEGVYYPVLNVASQEFISKYDFLNTFRQKLGVSESLLSAATSDRFPSAIQRPRDTSLDLSLLKTFYKAPSLDEGLERWIRDLKILQKQWQS